MTTVRLFARARELAGSKTVEMDGATVAEVLEAAASAFGDEFRDLLDTCSIVVDDELVARSEFARCPSGSELAVLPPVSGGDGPAAPGLRVAVLTVSDRASVGDYDDLTGPAIVAMVQSSLDAEIVDTAIVADEVDAIGDAIVRWCDHGRVDVVLTNGGTGLSPRDVTPEATAAVLDVQAPGLAELMRSAGLASTPFAALSRQTAGRRGSTVVVNLPGSVKGATESLESILAVLGHAVSAARGGGH